MEVLLIGVAVVSLGIAIAMSVVAWTLLRAERQRSAARVDALEALAFTDQPSEPEPVRMKESPEPVAARDAAATPEPQPSTPRGPREPRNPINSPSPLNPSNDEEWDLALGGQPSRDADQLVRTLRPERAASVRTDDLFDHAPAPSVTGRRWLAVATVVLVIGAGVAITTALKSPEVVAAIAASQSAGAARALSLLSLRHSTEADGTFTVTGLVQNPADGRELDRLEAVVYLFDDSGKYFAQGRAGVEVPAVAPGDETPFVVKVTAPGPVSRYRVGFRGADGHVVAHVDRRGQFPSGTTGDALDEPEIARPAGGMRPVDGAPAR